MKKVGSRGDAETRRVALRGIAFRASGLEPVGQPDEVTVPLTRDEATDTTPPRLRVSA